MINKDSKFKVWYSGGKNGVIYNYYKEKILSSRQDLNLTPLKHQEGAL